MQLLLMLSVNSWISYKIWVDLHILIISTCMYVGRELAKDILTHRFTRRVGGTVYKQRPQKLEQQ